MSEHDLAECLDELERLCAAAKSCLDLVEMSRDDPYRRPPWMDYDMVLGGKYFIDILPTEDK